MRTGSLFSAIFMCAVIARVTIAQQVDNWRAWAEQFKSVECLEVVAYSVMEGVLPPEPTLGQATVPEGAPPWSIYEIEQIFLCRDGRASEESWKYNGIPGSQQSESEHIWDVFNRKSPKMQRTSGTWRQTAGGETTKLIRGQAMLVKFPAGHDWTRNPLSLACEADISRAFLEDASDVTEVDDQHGSTATARFGRMQVRVRLELHDNAWRMVWNEVPVKPDGTAMVRTEFLDFAPVQGYPAKFPMRWRTLVRERADVKGIEVERVGDFWTNRVRRVLLCSPTPAKTLPPSTFTPDTAELHNIRIVTASLQGGQDAVSTGTDARQETNDAAQAPPRPMRQPKQSPVSATTYRLLGLGGLLVGAAALVWSRVKQ